MLTTPEGEVKQKIDDYIIYELEKTTSKTNKHIIE